MKLTSPRFNHGQPIPKLYTGEGENRSPPLRWSDVLEGARSFALVCEDPDAPTRPGKEHPFVHWVVYGLSAATTALPEGLSRDEELRVPILARQGQNSFGRIGYGGPLPPVGHGPHRYVFTLYALDTDVALRGGATKAELLEAIRPHVIDQATLKGTYARPGETTSILSGKSGRSKRALDRESRPAP